MPRGRDLRQPGLYAAVTEGTDRCQCGLPGRRRGSGIAGGADGEEPHGGARGSNGRRSRGTGGGARKVATRMARGWESKSVESQQEEAAAKQSRAAYLSPEEAQRRTVRATLMLARTRALADLQQACAPAHRAMLEQAIADLDRRLADAG